MRVETSGEGHLREVTPGEVGRFARWSRRQECRRSLRGLTLGRALNWARLQISGRAIFLAVLGLLLLLPGTAGAAQISDVGENAGVWEQTARFFSFRDPALRLALVGSILLGVSCGVLGSFLVVRRMALVGDTLSHAVLPGVVGGFMWTMKKDPGLIFVGAVCAGLFGTLVVGWITRTTKLKEDTALGLVLATFFAVGLGMLSLLRNAPSATQGGLDKVLFGQAAALSGAEVWLMAGTTAVVLGFVGIFYKELLASSFDAIFATSIRLPVRLLHHGLMFLLAAAVVVALQAVGVVLVSAMLIIPATTAYLLTDRLHKMVWLSALLGMAGAALGAFISFLVPKLPTGPCMVLTSSTIFGAAFFLAPRHGVVPRWWRRRARQQRIARENTLKAIYLVLEDNAFSPPEVPLAEVAKRRRTTAADASGEVARLARHGLATVEGGGAKLTEEGKRVAAGIVRNHRLWELYLTTRANFRTDHVHDDAEDIEHLLDEETVRQLEERLDFPVRDPHGKIIPKVEKEERA